MQYMHNTNPNAACDVHNNTSTSRGCAHVKRQTQITTNKHTNTPIHTSASPASTSNSFPKPSTNIASAALAPAAPPPLSSSGGTVKNGTCNGSGGGGCRPCEIYVGFMWTRKGYLHIVTDREQGGGGACARSLGLEGCRVTFAKAENRSACIPEREEERVGKRKTAQITSCFRLYF